MLLILLFAIAASYQLTLQCPYYYKCYEFPHEPDLTQITPKVWTKQTDTHTLLYFGLYGVPMIQDMIPVVTATLPTKRQVVWDYYPGESGTTCSTYNAKCNVRCNGPTPFKNSNYTVTNYPDCTSDIVWHVDIGQLPDMVHWTTAISDTSSKFTIPFYLSFLAEEPYPLQTGNTWSFIISQPFEFNVIANEFQVNGTAVSMHVSYAIGVKVPEDLAMITVTTSTAPEHGVIGPTINDHSGLGLHTYSFAIQNNGVTEYGIISGKQVNGENAFFDYVLTLCVNITFTKDPTKPFLCPGGMATFEIPSNHTFGVERADDPTPVREGTLAWSLHAEYFDFSPHGSPPFDEHLPVYLAAISIYNKRGAKWKTTPSITFSYEDLDGVEHYGKVQDDELVAYYDPFPGLDPKIADEQNLWAVLKITLKRMIVSKEHTLKYQFHGDIVFDGAADNDASHIAVTQMEQIDAPDPSPGSGGLNTWTIALIGVAIGAVSVGLVGSAIAGVVLYVRHSRKYQRL